MLLFSLALYVGISLMTEAPERGKLKEFTWSRAAWREESEELAGKPWWRNYRMLAAGLVLLTAAMVALFA